MPTSKKLTNESSGHQRASDFNGVLHAVPGQVAMMAVLQYSHKAQITLRQCEFDELIETCKEVGKILHDSGLPIDCTGNQAWPEDAERVNAEVREKYGAFPEVTDGFKKFVEDARAAFAASK